MSGENNAKNGVLVRKCAIESLMRWRAEDKYVNLEVDATLERVKLSDLDRAFYTALVYGAVERAITLDFVINANSRRASEMIDEETRCALWVGLYQLLYMDRVPHHAAVNATVSAAPKRSRDFVNAVLHAFIRSGRNAESLSDPSMSLSVKYSAPSALIRQFEADYPDRFEVILAASFGRPGATLRVNKLKTTVADALAALGEGAQTSLYFDDMILTVGESRAMLDGIERGLWFVQDASSRAAACVLGAKPGELVVDCCAAPGGKSFSLALDMDDRGEVRSFDLHKNKISLIREGASRLGLTCVRAEARDARECDPELVGRADRVLVDAPCSGLGVIAKKPDIKYKNLDDAKRLPTVQYAILSEAARYVKPGGTLVYSTCTLHRAENEDVFARFLAEHPDFAASDFAALGGESDGGALTVFPEGGLDGFFIARCVRTESGGGMNSEY